MVIKRFFIAVFIVCGAIIFAFPFFSDRKLHLVFCDVGQGDATLIKYKSYEVLVDGGPSGTKLLDCLSKNIPPWDREIELVVLSHPESDHLTGLIDVLEKYEVKQIVLNSIIKESAVFWQFRQKVIAEKSQIYLPRAGDQLKLGPLNLVVLWPKEKLGDNRLWQEAPAATETSPQVLGAATVSGEINNTSVVLKLSFGAFDALLSGDIGFAAEEVIDFPEVEVLKVPHHGSRYSTSEGFLDQSKPQLAVISVGKNSFGHPTQEVIDRLEKAKAKIRRTDQSGEIEIVSDGKKWGIKR